MQSAQVGGRGNTVTYSRTQHLGLEMTAGRKEYLGFGGGGGPQPVRPVGEEGGGVSQSRQLEPPPCHYLSLITVPSLPPPPRHSPFQLLLSKKTHLFSGHRCAQLKTRTYRQREETEGRGWMGASWKRRKARQDLGERR